MRFQTYQGARGGIGQALRNLGGSGRDVYGDRMRDLAYVDSAQASARNADSDTALNQQTYDAGERVMAPEMRATLEAMVPKGVDPGAYSSAWMASKNRTFDDFTKGFKNLNIGSASKQMMDATEAGNSELANALNRIVSGKPLDPYTLNDTGRMDNFTGKVDYTPGHQALVGERQAAGRANDALAAQRGVMSLAPGATAYSVRDILSGIDAMPRATAPMTPSQRGQGGDGRSDSGANLNAQLDEYFSSPAVDDSGQPVTDVLTGRQVMNVDKASRDAFLRWYGQRQQQYPNINRALLHYIASPPTPADSDGAQAGASRAETPPVADAQRAPDGSWYVQQNGRWFRVDQ